MSVADKTFENQTLHASWYLFEKYSWSEFKIYLTRGTDYWIEQGLAGSGDFSITEDN